MSTQTTTTTTTEDYCEVGRAFDTTYECVLPLQDVALQSDGPVTLSGTDATGHPGQMQMDAQYLVLTVCAHHAATLARWKPERTHQVPLSDVPGSAGASGTPANG